MPEDEWMKPAPKKDNSWMKPATTKRDSGSVVSIGGVQQNMQDSPDMYNFTPKFGQNNELLRAQDQSWYKQAGLALGNAAANIGTGLIEGFGYLPELLDESHDYSNAITRKMQELHNPLGEIYRENPNETFDLADPAWWFTNVQMLAESAGAFALEGIALGKVFGGIAKGAGELMSAGKTGKAITRATAQTLTAGTLAYTEGAMSGYRIYDEVYKKNYEKGVMRGMTHDEADVQAKQTAGEAAATTVKMNTIMNTLLNIGEVAPLFRAPTDEVLHWFKTAGRRTEGDLSAWRTRLAEASLDNPALKSLVMPRSGINSRIAEMAKEGIEEVNTQYAEAEGRRQGDGSGRSLAASLSDLDQYFNDVTNSEGALNFVLGAFGGAAQTLLIDHIPSRHTTFNSNNEQLVKKGADGKVIYGADGKPQYEQYRVSPKAFTERGTRQYFDNIKEAILSDVDKQQELQTKLVAAKAAGNHIEADQIRSEIFSIRGLDAVAKGMTENWQEEYKQIAAIDNEKDLGEEMQAQIDESAAGLVQAAESDMDVKSRHELQVAHGELIKQQQELMGKTEAMKRGFAKDKNDTGYKERAVRAQTDLKHLQDIHDNIQERYVDGEDPISGEVADHLFFRSANLYLRKNAIAREEARIEKIKALEELALMLPELGDEKTDTLLQKDKDNLQKAKESYEADAAELKTTTTNKGIRQLYADLAEERTKTIKELNANNKQDNLSKFFAQQTQEAADRLAVTEKEKLIARLEKQLVTLKQEYNETEQKREALERQVKEISSKGTFLTLNKTIPIRQEIAQLKRKAASLQAQIASAESQLELLHYKKAEAQVRHEATVQQQKDTEESTQEGTRDSQEYQEPEQENPETEEDQLETHYTADELMNFEESTATDGYLELKATLPEKALRVLDKIEAEHTPGKTEYGEILKRAFRPMLTAGEIKQTQVNNIWLKLKSYLKEKDAAITPAQQMPVAESPVANIEKQRQKELSKGSLPNLSGWLLEEVERNVNMFKHLIPEVLRLSYEGYTKAQVAKTLLPTVKGDDAKSIINSLRTYLQIPSQDFGTEFKKWREKIDAINAKYDAQLSALPAEPTLQEIDTPAVVENEQPLTLDNAALFTDDVLEALPWENSAKTTDAVKGNSSDLQYTTIAHNGRMMLRNKTVDGGPVFDTKTNKETLIPGAIQPGHKVYLQVDTEWDGSRLNDDSLLQDEYLNEVKVPDKFSDYAEDGKIRTAAHEATIGYGNMPIKVVDAATGKTLKYFPRVDWITATQGGSSFRNVSDESGPADEEGNRQAGNVQRQAAKNLAIRKRLAELHNAAPGSRLETTVTEVTGGRIMYHGDLTESTGKVKYRPQLAEKLLPGSIIFGIATKDGIFTQKGVSAATMLPLHPITERQMERLRGTPESPRTSVVAFIPMNNGVHMPVPMMTVPLNKRAGEINTVVRAVELYMQHGTDALGDHGQKLMDQIKDKTGYDISTPAGLKGFIEQYFTLTNGFTDSKTSGNAPDVNGKKLVRWLFDVPASINARKDGKADIKVGTTYSGKRPLRADLKNGKLNDAFRTALIAGLGTRMKNVNLYTEGGAMKGLNDSRGITQVTINSKDVLSAKEYPNYNAYLKSFVSTSVFGKHQVTDSKGKSHYVYAVNGQMMLDEGPLNSQQTVANARELISTPAEAGSTEVEYDDAADEMEALSNGSMNGTVVKYTIQPKGDELTLDNLQTLYNFTPMDKRNAKTPEQVFEHLQSLGISKIAEGYNPFFKC